MNFINYFGHLEGFDKLLNLMRWDQTLGDQVYKIPLDIMKGILNILRPVIPLMASNFKEDFLRKVK